MVDVSFEMKSSSLVTLSQFTFSNLKVKSKIKIGETTKNYDSDNDQNDHTSDDVFQFYEIGRSVPTNWRYPNIKKCVLRGCQQGFVTRSLAIKHFSLNHADRCVMCIHCDPPYQIIIRSKVREHYKAKHPEQRLSANWTNNIVNSIKLIIILCLLFVDIGLIFFLFSHHLKKIVVSP